MLASILEALREGTHYEFDEQVAVALILAIRAGSRNVLFRIDNDDSDSDEEQLVDMLTREVAWILHNLFALHCVPVDCRELHDRPSFHSALLSSSSSSSSSSHHLDHASTKHHRKPRRSVSHHPATTDPGTRVPRRTNFVPDSRESSSAGEDMPPTSESLASHIGGRRRTAARRSISTVDGDAAATTQVVRSPPRRRLSRMLNSNSATTATTTTPAEIPSAVIFQSIDKASQSAQQAMLDMFRERRLTVTTTTTTTSEQFTGTYNMPDTFVCVAIVAATAASRKRDEWGTPPVNRYLVDHFAYSATLSTSSTSTSSWQPPRAFFGHPLATTLVPLVDPRFEASVSASMSMSADMDTYVLDVLSAIRHASVLDARMLSTSSRSQLVRFAQTWARLVNGIINDDRHMSTTTVVVVVEPRDVLPVLLGVLGHRLRMLEPDREKSMFWGSDVRALEARRHLVGFGLGNVKSVLSDLVARV